MENLIVVTPQRITSGDLKSWVESKGGDWVNDEVQQGVIEQGTGAVYIAAYDGYFDEIDDAEWASFERRLSESPKSAVTFTISRARGSEELAEAVVASFCSDWAGVRASRSET